MIKRYSDPKLNQIFSETNKYQSWLDIELSVIEAYHHYNIIDSETFKQIKKKAKFTEAEILRREKDTRHDYMAFINTVMANLNEAEGKYFHRGITASDVVDSAQSLRLNQANQIIITNLNKLLTTILTLAKQEKSTMCMGRTHGMHAEITSLGLKLLNFHQDLSYSKQQFIKASQNVCQIILSGQVGNYNSVPMKIQEYVANKYKLKNSLISTQITSRIYHCDYAFACALIAASIEKLATEIRHLQRSEVNEWSESFQKKQTGSSDMPQKRNPILSENMCGLSRIIKSNVFVALQNVNLWHERDISHSSNERIYLEENLQITNFLIKRMTNVISNLQINYQQITKNVDSSLQTTFSHHILLKLTLDKNWTRENAYAFLKQVSQKSTQTKTPLQEILTLEKKWPYSQSETKKLFDKTHYIKEVDNIFKKYCDSLNKVAKP